MNMLQRLQKTVSAKAISMLLVVSMLFGALPANTVLVANAAGETNLRLHLMVADDQDFKCPALNVWDGSEYTLSGNGTVAPNGWNREIASLTKGETKDRYTDYSIVIKGTIKGLQLLDVDTENNNASRYQADVWDNAMAAFTDDEPTDLYAKYDATNKSYTWYTNEACTEELQLAQPAYFTLHFLDKDDWGYALVNYWDASKVTVSDTDGTGNKPSSWGEGTLNKLTKESEADETTGKDWYKVTFNGTITGFQILNSDGKIFGIEDSATIDKLNALTGETPSDVYLVDGIVYFDKADIPVSTATRTDLTVHFKNSKNWETVYAKFGYGTSWTAFEGYEYCMNNMGGILEKNSKNTGWYSFNISGSGTEAVKGLFNSGEWGDELQTNDYSISITKDEMEVWVTFTGETGKPITVSYDKPEGWVEGATVGKPINPATLSDLKSPVINGDGTVTFNFAMPASDSSDSVILMGSFDNWGSGQEMTYDEENGIYTTILTLKPGKYQYKFKTSAGNWYTDPLNSEYENQNSLVKVPGLTVEADNLAGVGPVEVTATIPEGSTMTAADLSWSIEAVSGNTVENISIEPDSKDNTKAYVTAGKDSQNGYFKVVVAYKEDGEEKTSELQLYHTKKAYLYEYKYKEDSEHTGKTDIYAWYNSQAGNVGYSLKEVEGDNIAYITLDDTTKNFGYIARLDGVWDDGKDREFSDRTLYVNTDDLYTKVKGGEGIQEAYLLPSGKTSYDNGIKFAYRDDERFYNNTMDKLSNSTVKVFYKLENAAEYTEATMTYSEQDELFTYLVPAEDLAEGNYKFYFTVEGTKVEDQYWGGEIEFRKPTLTVNTTVTPEKADYDMNPVVSFDINVSEDDIPEQFVSSITADLTNLGYEGTAVNFSTTTLSGVLYIDRSVAAGTYNVPCTITDIWGNDTVVDVPVKVVARTDASPSWDESTIYFLLTDRFVDGDTSNNYDVNKDKIEAYHGGDFKGLTSKLSYLQNLGVNTIWITPIVDNIEDVMDEDLHQQAYHGYWAKDFTKIDEHLGNTEDLDNLIDEAAKRGIKVMVDIVINHAGYNTNNNENFSGMLRTDEELVPGDVILDELDNLPDFKTEEEAVRAQLVEWQTAWANHETANGNRIAYFRVDTVKHVDHETWQELKTSVATDNPTFKMIGEYYGASINNTGDYLGNGQMDALLDFDFKSQAANFIKGNLEATEAALESRNSLLSSSLTMGQFLSSHDENGFLASSAGGDTAKAKVAASLQLTAKGVPVIYYGEEIALSGLNAFGKQDNNRYDMQFENLTKEQEAMLAHYQKLLAARNIYSDVFAAGDRTKVTGSDDDGYMVFKRSTASESVYVGLNTTSEAKKVTFSVSGNDVLFNAYSGEKVEVKEGQVTVTIPANSDGGTVILGAKKVLSDITIVAPTKTAYKLGEELDLTGLTVTGYYGGSRVAIQPGEYTVDTSKYNKNMAGTYEIVVSYGGFSKTFNVSVAEEDKKPVEQEQPEQPKDIEATGVTLSAAEASVERGKELTLTATVAPDNATNKAVVFTSDNEKVATVTADGVVTAVETGVANITATTANGKSATCKVTVIVPATKVFVNQSLRIQKGKTLQLTASVLPADSTDKLTWKSSNTNKVTVDENGKIKAVAAGSATITVTTDSGKKATCKVTVTKKAVKATKVTIKKTSKTMNVGDVKQLKVTVKPAKTTDTVTFKSSKKSVISVAKNGVMTAKKPGKATITVTAGKKKAKITITVKQPATEVTLNKTEVTIKKGKTFKLKATLTPKNSTDKVTYKSSKKSVATVSKKGVITAKKKGTATITVKTSSGKTAKCKVTVK